MKKTILITAICAICTQGQSQSWNLTGNAGTVSTVNFIGTTDNKALKFRTNNANRMTISSNGKVGIGTTTPVSKLDVKGGSINTDTDYRIGGYKVMSIDGVTNFFAGINSGYNNDLPFGGVNNTALGNYALFSNTWGQDNTAIGLNSLYLTNGAHHNTAVGAGTMFSNTSGNHNTAIGAYALNSGTGSLNTAVGSGALYNNTSGSNTAMGCNAMFYNTNGIYNVCMGLQALFSNTTASNNVAIGTSALLLQSYSNGNSGWACGNVAVGYEALYSNQPTSTVTGVYNTATGTAALYNNTYGYHNTAIGAYALYLNTSGLFNTGIGYDALYSTTTATRNTALGYSAGFSYAHGNYNTFVGAYCDANAAGYSNSSVIGDFAFITGSNQVRLGDMGVTSIGGYANWTNLSDGRFKTNVIENVPGIEFINKLRPVTYTLDVHGVNNYIGVKEGDKKSIYDEKSRIRYTGFIAQEVENAAAELGYDFSGVDAPKNEKDMYGLRYAEFVVPLVKAVQELDKENAELKMQNGEMLKRIEALERKNGVQSKAAENTMLGQNSPNPFTEKTVIQYSIPATARQAVIKIFSADGKELISYPVSSNGNGQIEISGNTLSVGTYTYMLIVDDKAADSKQMILTK